MYRRQRNGFGPGALTGERRAGAWLIVAAGAAQVRLEGKSSCCTTSRRHDPSIRLTSKLSPYEQYHAAVAGALVRFCGKAQR